MAIFVVFVIGPWLFLAGHCMGDASQGRISGEEVVEVVDFLLQRLPLEY